MTRAGGAATPLIEVSGLEKRYGELVAVAGVSFTIGEGEIFGLLGPNGAGKSTIIRMMTTLTQPDAGECRIDGLDVVQDRLALKALIGVVPQENNLDRELSAWENLDLYARLHRVPERAGKVRAALAAVDLLDRADGLAGRFSGGMKRRLLIARALLADPKALFLDEPSIGLDPQIRRQLWDVIRQARIRRKSVLLTTHYIEEAEALCDRVGILARGRLIALGTVPELQERVGAYVMEHIDSEGRLIQKPARSREEAHALAQGAGNGAVTVRRSNLEDVFIQLTGERI
ncbi:MAG: ABC transporter ATP-binding protein [Desulfobacteraceae bacterium]|nr:ABC transporter ATP-binding protein [Desulfobacteraceae bacterium]